MSSQLLPWFVKLLHVLYRIIIETLDNEVIGLYYPFQQLDLVSPFQLYFNPILIVKQYQVNMPVYKEQI